MRSKTFRQLKLKFAHPSRFEFTDQCDHRQSKSSINQKSRFDDDNGAAIGTPRHERGAQHHHLNSLRRLHALRYGAISIFGSLLLTQFGDAAPDASSALRGALHRFILLHPLPSGGAVSSVAALIRISASRRPRRRPR